MGPNGYIPSSITSANYTTGYDGDDLDLRGSSISIRSAVDQAVHLDGNDIVIRADKNLAVGGTVFIWPENELEITF